MSGSRPSIETLGTSSTFFRDLRVWRTSTLELHEIAPLTWRFLGRYVALGLVVIVAFIPFLIVDLVLARNHRGVVIAVGLVFALIGDVALTFVTPALAYTTGSVSRALVLGLRMLRSTWPRSAAYVLTPGLVLVSFAYFVPRRSEAVVVAAVVSIVTLWFKGAVAAFYLRVHPETDGFGA